MKSINEAMKKLQESKRISLKEANETATFELDWANEDIANMENNQEKELTLIKNVENTLKTNKIGAKVEIVSIDGDGFGSWPVVKVTGPKEDLAKNIGLYYLNNNEDEIDYNDIYDTYLENEDYWKDREAGKCYKCGKIIPDGEKYIIDGQQYCLDCKGDAEQELLDQPELERNIDNFNDYDESKTIKEDTEFYTDEALKEEISARSNYDKLENAIDEGIITKDQIADELMQALSDDDLAYYLSNIFDFEDEEDLEESEKNLTESDDKIGTFSIDVSIDADSVKDLLNKVNKWLGPIADKVKVTIEKFPRYSGWPTIKLTGDKGLIANKLVSSGYGDTVEEVIDTFLEESEKKEATNKIEEEKTKITLDDIANKASELGYEILGDERDDEGLTILVYKPESAETDNFDDFDNEELYSYLSTIPNVRYQIDNDDQSCLAIWLK